MTKSEANQLLNNLKDGAKLSFADTTRALAITGDYEADGSEGMDSKIQEEVSGSWDTRRFYMVVADIARYREKARSSSNE